MNAVASPKVLESLEIIAEYVSTSPAEAPAEFVRDLAQRWKEKGGTVAGKPRHSDRYLDDLLRWQGTPIRSLTPKLVGRTNLKAADADVLVRLFLSHWEYVGDPNSGEIAARSLDLYRPLLSDTDIEGVCKYVADRISAVGVEARSEGESETTSALPGQDTFDLLANEFKEAAALFQVSGGQTVLFAQADKALSGFKDAIDRLWAVDKIDALERILIWTVDLGRQDFEDSESLTRFWNVQVLAARFKALKLFKESITEVRWNWLQSRTVIVLHDTRSVRPEVPRLPAFDPHHVLFNAIPPRWAGSPEFLELYGHERLQQTNYLIFLKRPVEEFPETTKRLSNISSPEHQSYGLRYFGNALFKSSEKGEPEMRGLGLKAPGWSYVEALGTTYLAAAQMLGLRNTPTELSIDGMKIDSKHATEKLRHHGFRLLSLSEFLKL